MFLILSCLCFIRTRKLIMEDEYLLLRSKSPERNWSPIFDLLRTTNDNNSMPDSGSKGETRDEGTSVANTQNLEQNNRNNSEESTKLRICNVMIRRVPFTAILAILTVVATVGDNITLPLYTDALQKAGSSPYGVMVFGSFWFNCFTFGVLFLTYIWSKCFGDGSFAVLPKSYWKTAVIGGVLLSINGALDIYASPSQRTPPYLQVILGTTVIPYTIIFRYIILKKGVGVRRLVTCGCVLIGLFIAAEPTTFNLEGDDGYNSDQSATARIIWPVLFALGFLPHGILHVLIERELKKEASSIVLLTWVGAVNFICCVLLFWIDFIPFFGMTDSWTDFVQSLQTALSCHFWNESKCYNIQTMSLLYESLYFMSCLCVFMLTEYAEGAIFTAIVLGLVTPMGTIWWSIFNPKPYLHWDPEFTEKTAYNLAGLCIVVPSVIIYNIFSMQEERANNHENTQHNTMHSNTNENIRLE